MNRLWVRLTLAFVLVTLAGVAVIALLTDWNASRQFRQYAAMQGAQEQSGLVSDLAAYYDRAHTWVGAEAVLGGPQVGMGRGRGMMRGRPFAVLADSQGRVVYDERGGSGAGGTLAADERSNALAIQSAGRTVGWLYVTYGRMGMSQAEADLLDELRRTLFVAALVAGGLGIVLGLVISRTIAGPLADLAKVARAFPQHEWSSPAKVKGTDEIVDLARAFDEMAGRIREAETLRRSLMADIAHELRTPLSVLQGNLRAMLDQVYPLERSEIAILYDETRHLNHLIDDLRELALADAGRLSFKPQVMPIRGLVETAAAAFSMAAEAGGVKLESNVPEELRARADPDRVAQVIRNLLSNALGHTAAGGTLTLHAVREGREVKVTVTDTGEGIAPEDLPHVFDRFYRGDKSRTRASGGTGLGLAIAKAWVEAMGGRIGAESQVDHGTQVWFTLPAAERE